jgi:hypothetical protein
MHVSSNHGWVCLREWPRYRYSCTTTRHSSDPEKKTAYAHPRRNMTGCQLSLKPLNGLSSGEATWASKERKKPGKIQSSSRSGPGQATDSCFDHLARGTVVAQHLQIQIGEIIKYRNLPFQPHNTSRYSTLSTGRQSM